MILFSKSVVNPSVTTGPVLYCSVNMWSVQPHCLCGWKGPHCSIHNCSALKLILLK